MGVRQEVRPARAKVLSSRLVDDRAPKFFANVEEHHVIVFCFPCFLSNTMSASVSAFLPQSFVSWQQQLQHEPPTVQRTLLSIQVPQGTLQMMVSPPAHGTFGHVWVASLQSGSPVLGRILPGDWIISINGIPVTTRDACVHLFRNTSSFPRTVCVSRAAIYPGTAAVKNHKDNNQSVLPPAVTAKPADSVKTVATSPVVKKPEPKNTAVLIEMTTTQLKDELKQRGLSQTGTKDILLERLGVPVRQWKQWRKMKIPELKQELRQRGLTVVGSKHELLSRLGVPIGFGESFDEKFRRERMESNKKKRKLEELSKQVTEHHWKSPEDDPGHEEYTIPCCKAPRFDAGRREPAGCIMFPDGSMMEVWRCLACGKIPEKPNAPPIQEFSDDEGEATDVYDDFLAYCDRAGLPYDDEYYW